MDIQNLDGISYMKTISDKSVDLILTDPPYITSIETGMGNLHNKIKSNEENGIKYVKTEEEWNAEREKFSQIVDITEEKKKENYMKYGTIYGSKFAQQTEYGDWDSKFTIELLEEFVKEYYKKLKNGGTLIMFFDWKKITPLYELFEKYNFKQIRLIEWVKTNPVPRNSNINYLSNAKEIALVGIKDKKPTFNSSYDKGIYEYPTRGGKNTHSHPTKKSISLFEELIKKHTNEGDTVMDTFLGSGTTAIACKSTNRKFLGCETNKIYYDEIFQYYGSVLESESYEDSGSGSGS
jgi:DNA modification methylase